MHGINLNLDSGQVQAIVGKSGCGKSTLLKCIYGLEDLKAGEITIHNQLVTGPSYNLIPGNENMGLVSQDFYVLDNHTVTENIKDKLPGFTDEFKNKRCLVLLRLLELNALKNTQARFLSSGQKQRVAIARALAQIPPLLLLDEPFSNLDHLLTEKLFDFIIREVKKNKTAVLLITHLAEEALKYADKIAIMDNGKIIQQGDKWSVYYQPKNLRLAGLLGEFNIIRKEDLISKKGKPAKIFLRPDRFSLCSKNVGDISVTVKQSTYTGKCHEILAETANGHQVLIYSATAMPIDKVQYFKISF